MKANLRIQTDRIIGHASSLLRGLFIENHHRCIYGGLWEEGSPLSDEREFRRDVLGYIKALQPGVVRFPGGNFACDYDWREGVLPIEQRPKRFNYGTNQVANYRVGTHELLEYCSELGAAPMLTTNAGTAGPSLAADWVQYCNGNDDGYYSSLRRANGFPKPWNVPYWCLGNEMYGDWIPGTMTGEEYGRYVRDATRLMKSVDPDIKLSGMASGTYLADWDRAALDSTVDLLDYVSLHVYVGRRDYYSCVGSPAMVQMGIDIVQGTIESAACKMNVRRLPKIALDEYNIWYRTRHHPDGLEEKFNLQDALAMAGIQHVLFRNAKNVGMACLSFPVNTMGAVMSNTEGAYRQTIYWPLQFVAEYFADEVVDCFTNCPTFTCRHPKTFPGIVDVDATGREMETETQRALMTDFEDLPYLDTCVTFDSKEGRLVLSAVNRHETESIEAGIQVLGSTVDGFAEGRMLTAGSVKDENSFNNPDNVTPRNIEPIRAANEFTYSFPAHSHTVLVLQTQ